MGETPVAAWITLIAAGYLLGSALFCQWLPMLIMHTDVSGMSDDGNPGAVNVFTLCGWRMGLFCPAMDMVKGYLPVFAALKWLDGESWWMTAVMLGPVLGHAFSCLHHLNGGKCIAVIFGEMLALLWITPVGLLLAGLFILFSTVAKIDPHRKRSLLTFACFLPAALALEWALGQISIGVGCAAVSTVALIKLALDQGMKRNRFAATPSKR